MWKAGRNRTPWYWQCYQHGGHGDEAGSVFFALVAAATAAHHEHGGHHVALELKAVVGEAVDGHAVVVEQIGVVGGYVAGDEVDAYMVVVGEVLQEGGVAEHELAPRRYHLPVVAHLLTGIAERVAPAVARERLVVVGRDGAGLGESAGRSRSGFSRANWANWTNRTNGTNGG